jgi:hypothetical protein
MSWFKRKKLFKYEIPELEEYIGRTVEIDGKPVKINRIVGNFGKTLGRRPEDQRPQYLEINGEHNISMLRFFAQMNGATDITEEQFKAFEDMQFYSEVAQKTKDEKAVEQIVSDIMKGVENGEKG